MHRTMVAGACLWLAGCLGTTTGNGMWAKQYEHVRMIPDPESRASAMASVALAAAYGGEVDTVKSIVNDLKGHPKHDEVASRCAVQLSSGDHKRYARRVAKLIEDETKRTEVLAKLDGKSEKKDEKKSDDAEKKN